MSNEYHSRQQIWCAKPNCAHIYLRRQTPWRTEWWRSIEQPMNYELGYNLIISTQNHYIQASDRLTMIPACFYYVTAVQNSFSLCHISCFFTDPLISPHSDRYFSSLFLSQIFHWHLISLQTIRRWWARFSCGESSTLIWENAFISVSHSALSVCTTTQWPWHSNRGHGLGKPSSKCHVAGRWECALHRQVFIV